MSKVEHVHETRRNCVRKEPVHGRNSHICLELGWKQQTALGETEREWREGKQERGERMDCAAGQTCCQLCKKRKLEISQCDAAAAASGSGSAATSATASA